MPDRPEAQSEQAKEVEAIQPGDQTFTLDVDGLERNYIVHAPPDYDKTRPIPIVFVFHGGGTNANWVRRFCGLSSKADRANFLAVFPSGSGARIRRLSWNCPGSGFERWTGAEGADADLVRRVDEVAFVRAMIADLSRRGTIDSQRIFASGVSTGAALVYYLAGKMPDEIASIAAIGGPIGTDSHPPSRPMPVIHFHGTDDNFAPYHGGQGKKSFTGLEFNSVAFTMETWSQFIGCQEQPSVEELPQKTDNSTHVTKSVYAGRDDSEIVLYTIWGGGHTWPGQDPRMELMGKYTQDIQANDLVWDFFSRHPLRRGPTSP